MNVKQTVPLMYVSDIDASCRFYCDGLGFSLDQKWEPNGKLAWCWLNLEGAAVMLQQGEPGDLGNDPRINVYFLCEDVDVIYSAIRERVAAEPPTIESYGMKQLFVTDPDGNRVCFENPVER